MSLLRVNQYLQRFIHVYIFYIVGQAQVRKMKILEEVYQYSVDFLNQTGEAYWLDFGTLLGFYRVNGILSHDIDVDFGMREASYPQVLSRRNLLTPKLKFYDTSHRHHGPKLYLNYKGFDVDIYFYEDFSEAIRSYEKTNWPNERQLIPKRLIFPLQPVQFLGKESTIPANSKEYLGFIYGYLGADAKRDQKTGFWIKDDTIN